ncbi:MAG: NAD(P)-dependent oxidoreductase [Thermodesulfobacteriota bacterium]
MILVFGAGGFIGTYLIDELVKRKFNVIASDTCEEGETFYKNRNIPYVQIDITNNNDFKKIAGTDITTVICLAALQPANISTERYDPVDYIKVNTIGCLHILEFAKTIKARKTIFAYSHRNTSALWEKGVPIKEDDGRKFKYDGEYAMFSISESAAQDCIEHYRTQYGMPCILFRLPPVYGYGPHIEIYKNGKYFKTGFLTFIENSMTCKPIEVWGDSNAGRDIIYVKDVVSAFIKAITTDRADGLYNIASGKLLTLKEEVAAIAKVFWGDAGRPVVIIERPDKPHFIETYLYDISRAKRDLNWTPEYDFESMLTDYKKEMQSDRFGHLVCKRKKMFNTRPQCNGTHEDKDGLF